MSNTESDQIQCAICGKFVGESGVAEHLHEHHADDPEDVEEKYGQRMADRVFNDTGDEVEAESLDVIDGARRCGLCGEVLEPSGEELTEGEAKLHLRSEHPDVERGVSHVFDGLNTAEDSPDGIDDESIEDRKRRGSAGSIETEQAAVPLESPEVTQTESDDSSGGRPSSSGADATVSNGTGSNVDAERGGSSPSFREEIATRGKFSIFGVGGAGNRLLDAMIMRRDTLRDRNSRLAKAWEGGLNTYLSLNTNDSEIVGTYYQTEDQDLDQADVMVRCLIGDNPSGAGEDPEIGLMEMNHDIANSPAETIRSWPFNQGDLRSAQSVMFVHSVVKGTGSGSTPPLAEYVREELLDERHGEKGNTPMMAVTVLPNERATKFNPEGTVNAGFGIGMIASRVNVVIPFDNERLGDAAKDITPDIDGLGDRNPAYSDVNRPLVQFLEAFMLSSNSEMIDQETMSKLGASGAGDDGFDVPDSFRPIAPRYPLTGDDEIRPGVVAAPLMAVSESSQLDETGIGILIESAFNQGLLVDCEPETAWGGTFMFYGPEEPMADVSGHIRDFNVHEKITESLGTTDLRLRVNQAVVPEVDDLHMWGLLWNPKMPAMEQMFQKTKEAKERNNDHGRMLSEHWDEIRPVYEYLGRENME